LTKPVNVGDYERLAAEQLDAGALSYFSGGAGDEQTLRENLEAYRRWHLRPRVLCDVTSTTTATTVLGTEISMPLLVAPVAFQRVANPDGEAGTARAAASTGTIMCLSTIATTTPADVAAAAPEGKHWFQLYVFKDWGVTKGLIDQAVEAGFSALVLTVDTPYLGRREGPLRTEFEIPHEIRVPAVDAARGGLEPFSLPEHFSLFSPAVSWRDLERLRSLSRLPVVLKGILTAEDAALACEHGADAIIVSNHGGRQLDGVSGTLDALPEVAETVDGRIEVLLDGGIRRGVDVVKALALGARACLAGRAVLWGLTVGGEAGARRVLELLRNEISLALSLLGCTSPDEVRREHVGAAPR
jgi:isopentenyl diphosphate isomerase/L-lactate dehydrogenase-like FMN-dependent dehydrogenase